MKKLNILKVLIYCMIIGLFTIINNGCRQTEKYDNNVNVREWRKPPYITDYLLHFGSDLLNFNNQKKGLFYFDKKVEPAECKLEGFNNYIFPEGYTFTSVRRSLGQNEAMRTYLEFADGTNRGIYDSITSTGGFPDEDFDATTTMVINWHKIPEQKPDYNARLEYRQEYPDMSDWKIANGESFNLWHREELINRVILRNLQPNSVYAYRVKKRGKVYRFRTMPASLDQRPVTIVLTGDHQRPIWDINYAHDNAKMTALLKPDMFVMTGDYVNCAGNITPTNADRWALFLDYLYNSDDGYFIYEITINGNKFSNIVTPIVTILGNHETGDQQHIRWPSCVATSMSVPGYPMFTSANWMELLYHFPYKSEGFYCEYRPDHPNRNKAHVQKGFGKGGFGSLSFSDYLLLIGLDNSQNWEGKPDKGLRDWEGNLITDKWPWYETQYSDIRQDIWLQNLLEPKDCKPAGERYKHIIPFWHRGLFGSVRMNMTLKNRGLMEYWLPVLYRNGVKFIGEGHDHVYGHTVPMGITKMKPANTYIEKVYYQPRSWKLTPDLPQSYLDEFYAVNCIKDNQTHEIVGWEYKGQYITYNQRGMRAFGHGGWAAGRGRIGGRGAGNAGWWFMDNTKGGLNFTGPGAYHINLIKLYPDSLVTKAINPSQLLNLENGVAPELIHHLTWNKITETWIDVIPDQ